MYKLYYSPGSCSMSVHVALLECNQAVTLQKIDLMSGEGQSPEFKKINPRGQVPVLVDDDQILREGAAILMHILEKHNSPLLPKQGKERDVALEWLMFCNATLHPAYARCFFLKRNAPEGEAREALFDIAAKMISKLWEEVEARLETQPYLCGKDITIADILMTVIANWNGHIARPIVIGPRTKKLFQSVIARPAFQKAMEIEHVEYKAAA